MISGERLLWRRASDTSSVREVAIEAEAAGIAGVAMDTDLVTNFPKTDEKHATK